MNDVEYYKEQIKDYERQIAVAEEKEQREKLAKSVHDIYVSFIGAGFTEEQALWFVSVIFQKAIDSICE